MIEVFLKGIGVGVAVAAPVGPIGLLCIKRTLAEGRRAGLATGLGAACADAVYGLCVAAGFAATGVLVRYAGPMAVFGGVLIAGLGLLSLRAFFQGTNKAAQPDVPLTEGRLIGAFATTFVLTLSNPMTILAFVALVAGLGASAAAHPLAPYWLVLGVFLGSALWWLMLVHISLIAKSRITPAAMRWLDFASGTVLLCWGAWIAWRAFAEP